MARTNNGDLTAVRQVGRMLDAAFDGRIDMSDFESNSEEQRKKAFRSRALAALAVRMVTGWQNTDAAEAVIDGRDDQGIDAIAVTSSPPHVYLVQAKWSDQGRATARTDAILKMFAGLRLIDGEESSQFNPRGQLLAEQAKEAMSEQAVGVTLVTVLMGAEPPSREVLNELVNGEREFNTHGDRVDHRFLHASDVWNWARADAAPAPVAMSVKMDPWFSLDVPHQAFQGVVKAEQVAGWLDTHGTRLFELNIRNPLDGTLANEELVATLTDEPSLFWYFNNGITVLCDTVDPLYDSMRNPHGGPVVLRLSGASVVNGAQTVRAVQRALESSDDPATARVGVRVIATGGATDFSSRTTRATNRQNQVGPRDFAALDPVQAEIRADLRAELGKSYSVKRGELSPSPETGCSLDEAATALACAHPNAEYAGRAASSPNTLWERGSKETYDILFRPQPSAFQVWRSVVTMRLIRNELHRLRPTYEKLPAAVLEHGTYLMCHLVFRQLGTDRIDDPDLDWESDFLPQVPAAVGAQLAALVDVLEKGYTSRVQGLLSDPDKCRELAAKVAGLGATGGDTAGLVDRYGKQTQARKRRRPNAVPTLVDHQAIKEGTPLRFVSMNSIEQEALADWLAEDDRRSRVTWVNDRTKPLLWEADGRRYSPSGLVTLMWGQARWEERPVSNQGTARWQTSEGATLAALAFALQDGNAESD
ncbi:AIPR family protein [Kitasatospora sp. NPDC058032]|uniref:AIPR family protein n=1 Tax=Kitasatospora sp. NPDC058032 TaxID=3346307 RepID=UPI0036DF6685